MEWSLVNRGSLQNIYELRDDNGRLLVLADYSTAGTIRLSANDEKRVFFVRREGFLRNRTVLRNEYGIRIGQLTHEGGQTSHGSIEISNKQFTYTLQNNPLKVSIY